MFTNPLRNVSDVQIVCLFVSSTDVNIDDVGTRGLGSRNCCGENVSAQSMRDNDCAFASRTAPLFSLGRWVLNHSLKQWRGPAELSGL